MQLLIKIKEMKKVSLQYEETHKKRSLQYIHGALGERMESSPY